MVEVGLPTVKWEHVCFDGVFDCIFLQYQSNFRHTYLTFPHFVIVKTTKQVNNAWIYVVQKVLNKSNLTDYFRFCWKVALAWPQCNFIHSTVPSRVKRSCLMFWLFFSSGIEETHSLLLKTTCWESFKICANNVNFVLNLYLIYLHYGWKYLTWKIYNQLGVFETDLCVYLLNTTLPNNNKLAADLLSPFL